MLIRKQNWPLLLSHYLIENKDRPFKWHDHDCISHAFKAVQAMTGKYLISHLTGRYDNEKTAYKIVEQKYNDDTDNIINEALLSDSCENVFKAHRGDIVMMLYKNKKTYGIIDDSGKRAVFVSNKGFIYKNVNECKCFWGV